MFSPLSPLKYFAQTGSMITYDYILKLCKQSIHVLLEMRNKKQEILFAINMVLLAKLMGSYPLCPAVLLNLTSKTNNSNSNRS